MRISIDDYFDEVLVPHTSFFAYGEAMSVLEERRDAVSLRRFFERILEVFVEHDEPWDVSTGRDEREKAAAQKAFIPSGVGTGLRTVFLSSTSPDLKDHRAKVIEALHGLDGWDVVTMEQFAARDAEADEFCRQQVAASDVFVGAIGACYGSIHEASGKSYTEREYDAALEVNKPRLIFLVPKDFPLPLDLIEDDEKRKKQRDLKQRASQSRIRDTFTSPDDLARRVVSALQNLRHQGPGEPGNQTLSLRPLPPQPHFAHPYPIQPNFTGRVRERRMLTEWLTEGTQPLMALIAIGGMGKSALAWAWLQRDVLGLPLPGHAEEDAASAEGCRVPDEQRPEGVLWWSFYERDARFASFLDEALAYASGGKIDAAAMGSPSEKVRALLTLLQQKRILLVLDGFERDLRAYEGLNAAYQGDAKEGADNDCVDPHAGDWLRAIASYDQAGRVLLTSRLFPKELHGPDRPLVGCRREDLHDLDSEDAVTFFQSEGIQGTRAEIRAAIAPYGRHPLSLRLLAGAIRKDRRTRGDIRAAGRLRVLDKLRGKEQHHILQVAYDAALEELESRGLLFIEEESGRYRIHPIVRQYAYDRLEDKEGVHSRLRDYFDALPVPDKVESVDDLAPVIELYHHTVGAGGYDEAFVLFRDRLSNPLYYRFGAYQKIIELMGALFPDGEDRPPRLKDEGAQAWTLAALANSHSLSGQPRLAVPVFEMASDLDESLGDKKNLAIGLGNLADGQANLGELAAAEHNLRRQVELCREINDEFKEAIAHQELGRLLADEGRFDEADQALEASTDHWKRTDNKQGLGIHKAYRALRSLLMGDPQAALEAARQSRELVGVESVERDIVQAEWQLGWAHEALASQEPNQRDQRLAEAEKHLTEALTRCRRINLVEVESDILLAWARWHRTKGEAGPARRDAQEALRIADRCDYRLKQADIHNFLARIELDTGDLASARTHAETAKERAECDGPPHCYKPAFEEAERLLAEIDGR